MTEEKRKELAKDLNKFTRLELNYLAELSIHYDIPLTKLLELMCEGHKEMVSVAQALCADDKPEIVKE